MIADFNPETGELDIYNGNQARRPSHRLRARGGAGRAHDRIQCQDIGGGFGNKVPVYPGYVCAIAGSIVAGVPVKWVENRSENLMSTGFARDYVMRAEMCSKDGKITGLRVDAIADHGAFDSTAQPTKFPAGFFHIVCGSYDLEARTSRSRRSTRTRRRGRGLPVLVPHHRGRLPGRADGRRARAGDEGRSDRPAHEQLHWPEQFPYETTTGWTYDSGDYAKTMGVAMEIAGYEELRREQAEKRERGELMGIGVSFFTEGVGAGPRKHMDILGLSMNDGADLRVHPSGKAAVDQRADPGPGPRDHVRRRSWPRTRHPAGGRGGPPRDTDKSPYGLGTYGSRSTPVSGEAVAVVSRKVRDKARLIAATMLETRPEDLAWEKGRWYVKGDPEKGAMIEEVAARAYSGEPMPGGSWRAGSTHR